MKKLYTLILVAMSSLAFSQQFVMPTVDSHTEFQVPKGNRPSLLKAPSPTIQGTRQAVLWYDSLDRAYGIDKGFAYQNFFWRMNAAYTGSNTATGGFMQYAIVAYDSLWDLDASYIPKADISKITIDAISFRFGYNNVSNNTDSLKIKVIALGNDGYPSTGVASTYTTVTVYGNGVDFSSGTTYLSREIQSMVVPVNFTLNTGVKRFGLRFEYHGSTQDTFNMDAGFNYGGTCTINTSTGPAVVEVAERSHYPNRFIGNSFEFNRFNNILLPTTTGDIFIDCDDDDVWDTGTGDGYWFTQNWVVATDITIDDGLGIQNLEKAGIGLSQNFPNPFSDISTVNYSLTEKCNNVKLNVYDITGKLVIQMNEGERAAGKYSLKIDGSKLINGVYYYSLVAGNKTSAVKKMVITE